MQNADFLNGTPSDDNGPTLPVLEHSAHVGPMAAAKPVVADGAAAGALRHIRGLWKEGKVERAVWLQIYAGCLHGVGSANEVIDACDLADLAYFQMLQRQNGR